MTSAPPVLAAFGIVVGAIIVAATAAPAAGERVMRGVHEGRSYRLYVPAAPASGRPLIVALHGCAQTPDDFALGTRLDRAAGRRALRVLYPAQRPRDNPARCWNWFAAPSPARGETAAILALVREMLRVQGGDAARVVVLGLSAGGYMAVNLACAAPDLVVAVGVAAGGPYRCADTSGSALNCMRGVRLDGRGAAARCATAAAPMPSPRASLWHGDGDSVVSPANLGALRDMFVELWTRREGTLPSSRHVVDGATRTLYRAAGRQAVIESWIVTGMGHAWSGGDPRGTHTYPAGPDATEAMLRFLVDE